MDIEIFNNIPKNETIAVGFSGGMDSLALAILLKKTNLPYHFKLIYVDHGKDLDDPAWIEHNKMLADKIGLDFDYIKVDIENGNIENAMRNARYNALKTFSKYIVIAHHQGDSVENFFLKLMNGANTKSLCGIKKISYFDDYTIYRPLLSYNKTQLNEIVKNETFNNDFIHDPMNKNLKFHRPWVRNELIPQFENRFNYFWSSMKAVMQNMSDANDLIEEIVNNDLNDCKIEDNVFCINKLSQLSDVRLMNLIKKLFDNDAVSRLSILNYMKTLKTGNSDSKAICQSKNITLYRKGNRLYKKSAIK